MARTELDPRDPERPKYRQLADDVRVRIDAGEFDTTGMIPSKRTLRQEYATSASTVELATRLLKEEGLVRWKRGYGLIIVPPEDRAP